MSHPADNIRDMKPKLPQIDEAEIAAMKAAILADPTPPAEPRVRITYEDVLELNRQGRERLRESGGLSTTVNFSAAGRKALAEIRHELIDIASTSEAVNVALRWLAGHLAESHGTTLRVGGQR